MKTKYLIQAAIIGGIYAALTLALPFLSYGPVQIRVSEALTILPVFTPAAIPGLFIGCFAANLLSPYGVIDLVCGSLATLAAAIISYKLKKWPLLVPLPPVLMNGIIVGGMLHYAYGVPNLFACMLWVALGEAAACYIIGLPLMKLLGKYKGIFQ